MSMTDPKLAEDIASVRLTFLDRAIPLIALGFEIIPVQPNSKDPFRGLGALSRSNDPVKIQEWAERFPDANVAICSNDEYCILESDDVKEFSRLIKNATAHELPVTLMACGSSENRPHMFFRHTARSRTVGCLSVPGLFEARFKNMYVVGPGSRHPSGSTYRFVNDAPILEIPDWLVSGLSHLAQSQKSERKNAKVRPCDAQLGEGEGRHQWLMSEAGRLWDGKKSAEQLLKEVMEINERDCAPPRTEGHVADMVRWVMEKGTPNEPAPKVVLGGSPLQAKSGEVIDPDSWRSLFHTYEESVNAPPLAFAIKGFLQEDGITVIGGLAGHGKTLLMLNMALVLLEGGCLFGHEPFAVTRKGQRVVYLVPESGLGPFVHRLKLFNLLPHVKAGTFLYRTLSAKEDVTLSDPRILRAVEGADVFLDTAVRFLPGDENSATDQKEFAQTLFRLLAAGAKTITGAHHAPKNFERKDYMTLENALRGSGDIGAMLATCWVVRQTDKAKNRIYVQNVKPRDFEPCEPFEIEGRPSIDQRGQFTMSKEPGMTGGPSVDNLNRKHARKEEAQTMRDAGHTYKDIAERLGVSEKTVSRMGLAGRQQEPDIRQT
jgi:hypothetical protein